MSDQITCPDCGEKIHRLDFVQADAFVSERGEETELVDLILACPECEAKFNSFVPITDFSPL